MSTDSPTPDKETPVATSPLGRVNIFFRIATGLVGLFVITIFALIAVLFGDPTAPVAKLLDRIGMQLILGEMFAILIFGTLAMTVDRRST
jgi:hypothetical protein